MFTNERLFTIQALTITRVHCIRLLLRDGLLFRHLLLPESTVFILWPDRRYSLDSLSKGAFWPLTIHASLIYRILSQQNVISNHYICYLLQCIWIGRYKQFGNMAILSPNSLNIKMEPNQEVRFSGDFRESTIECLTLRNPGRTPLLFKV